MNRLYVKFLLIFLFLGYTSSVTAQVTSGSFSGTCTDTGTATWTNGTNTTIIFAKAGSAVTVGTPSSNIASINASAAFGSGDAYQNDAAAFCVYKGTGTSVNITNLTAGVTYHFLAFDATGTTYSASHTFSGASLTNPPDGTTLAGTIGDGEVSLSWSNPTCMDEMLIVAKPTSTIAGTPTGDGTSYTANANFTGGGTAFDTSGKVVYKSNGTSVTVTGLTNGTTYFFKLYTRKGTAWSSGTEISATPYGPVSGGAFNTDICLTTGTATWTNPATVSTIVVFAKAGSAVTAGTPSSNISTYTADGNFSGTGTAYENDAAAKCVYKGTGNSINITGLTAGVTYHFLVYNANGTNYSPSHTFSGTTLTTPPNVTALTPTPSTNSVDLTWANPACFDEVLIVAKTSTVAGTPTGDGTSYTADSNFGGAGSTFDTSGKVVYKGTGTSLTVTGLSVSTQYYFRVFTRKGTTWSAGSEVNTTTICTPVNVTGLKVSDAATTTNIYWTDPACFDEFLIVAKQGTASTAATISVAPTGDGTSYTANASYTGGGTAFDGGKVVFKSGTNPGAGGFQVTNLTTGVIYTFKIFTRKGTTWSSGAVITTVPGPPVLLTASLIPADGSTGVPTNQVFTAVFNEKIYISATGASSTQDDIEFDPASGGSQFIARGDGSPAIVISSKSVNLTPATDLTEINTVYNILIGSKVFRDSTGNDFGGTSAGDWNFTTATGISFTPPTIGTCVGQFTSLGDFVLSESSAANFQGTDNGTYTLVLGFDKAGFIFDPNGISASVAASGDIESIAVTSVSYTQITLTVDFFNVSNDNQAKDALDVITITGLKISRDGSVATPAIMVVKAASTLVIQGIAEDTTPLATINSGTASSAPTVTWPNSNDNSYCIGTDLSTITVTASGGSGYKWYNDAALTSNIGALNGNATPTAAALGFSSAAAGIFTKYVTNSGSGCESSATAVTLIITSAVTADAGTAPAPVCPGTSVNIGGAPTATGGAGSYTYSWTSSPVGFTSSNSNPVFTAANATGSDIATTYTVTVTDGNGCQANDNVSVTVKTISQSVIFTQPNTFNYTTNNNPVNLVGSPAGGTFSGVGVIQLNSGYQFDPELAGIGTWPVTYTTTLANGCTKSISQDFTVSTPFDVFPNLESQYCNNEGQVNLTISATTVAEVQNYINNWNTNYVPAYGYAPLKATFTGIVRNEYETYYGDNNSVIPVGSTYSSGGLTLPLYRFNPQALATDQAYPVGGGIYGTCATCNYAYISIYIEFADVNNTYPYNISIGQDQGYYFNNGTVAAFSYNGEFVYSNPVPVVNFSGLLPNYCDLNINYDLTGNKTGGFYEISSDGSTFDDDDAPVDGIKDQTEGVAAGLAIFNPLEASGGAVSSVNRWIRYSVDPGTTGSTGQGCVGRDTEITTIYPSTAITFDASVPAEDTEFCYEGLPFDIITNLGTPVTGVTFTGFGISDNGNGSARFTPKTAFDQQSPGSGSPQTITITATYTNAQGCAYAIQRDFIVRPLPTSTYGVTDPSIPGTPPDNNYCYNDGAVTLQGNQPANSTFEFVIDYLSLARTDNIAGDNMVFNPTTYYDNAVSSGLSDVSDATFNVTYIVTDQIGCTASSTKLFAVSPLDDITIAGISDGDQFCSNQIPFKITFGPDNGSLFINGQNESNQLDATNSISFNDLPIGNSIEIEYVYLSGISQCTNSETIYIDNVAAPVADFTTSPVCDGNEATFNALPNPNNFSWKWVLGDSVRSGTDKENIQHIFPGLAGASQTSYLIRLIVENDGATLLCKDSTEAIQVVGAYPNVDFNYARVCEGDFTQLTIVPGTIPIATAEWDFDDGYTLPINPLNADIPGGTHAGNTQGKFGNPEHRFAYISGQSNYYSVKLTARTASNVGACPDSIRREVGILENITPTPLNPYIMANLNGGDGLWLREDRADSTTWVFATPSGKTVIDNSNGVVWITNSSSEYKAEDNSYVNSPCFDLSAFNKPVISLNIWSNTDAGKDGAILQYSLNGGATWTVLGTSNSGLNWYNNNTIAAAPGGFNQYGWNGRIQQQWLEAKHALDAIIGNSNVRFRIAFASDEREQYDGFAFNNVVIEERNRIMLVEHFSNVSTDPNIIESTTNYNSDLLFNNSEVIKIQYHTSYPNAADPINNFNPADLNARAAYYGLTSQTIPLGFIDGGRDATVNVFGFVTPPTKWWDDFMKKRALKSSPYDLQVQSEPTTPTELQVRVTGTRIASVPGNKPVLHVVVLEKDTLGNEHVVRKLLPNAAGTHLDPTALTVDEVFTWIPAGITSLGELRLVAFIQDEVTKEIHQATSDINPTNLPTEIITGIEDPDFASKISIHPNPANQEMNVVLPGIATTHTPLVMVDAHGKAVYQNAIPAGETSKTINTSEMTPGVYILQLGTPGGGVVRKKVMVVH